VLGGDGPFGARLDRWLALLEPGTSRLAFVGRALGCGLLSGALMLLVLTSRGGIGLMSLTWVCLAAIAGCLAPYVRLRNRAKKRRVRIMAELPHVAGLLSVALSAGLPLDVALSHVGERSTGVLGRELLRAQQLAGSGGWRLHDALAGVAKQEQVPGLDMFVDQLRAADEQGLALGPWLDTFVISLQEQDATRLLTMAEKGSVKMIVPLALIMAPVSVVVVLAPGLMALINLVGR
jgi:tight adherence protein C